MTIPRTAMLLAAGLGTRMRPITSKVPKPMVKVLNKALVDHALDRLVEVGVTRAVINLYYKAEMLQQHLQTRPDIEVIFSIEKKRLETGGGTLNALKFLGTSPFFVINTDNFWLNGPTNALERLALGWRPQFMDIFMLLHPTVNAYGYDGLGDFFIEPSGILVRRSPMHVAPWLFTGIQILHPRIFKNISDDVFSLNVLYDKVLAKQKLYGCIHEGEWFHVGTPAALAETEAFLSKRFSGQRYR